MDKILKIEDRDHPETYFIRFDAVFMEAKILEKEWATKLVPLLSG